MATAVVADCKAVTTSPIQTATATLHTNRGDIKIALFGNHAPKTVANFVGLAQGTKEYSTENASGVSIRFETGRIPTSNAAVCQPNARTIRLKTNTATIAPAAYERFA